MANVFIVSDTHFGHQNICKFTKGDGTKLRPWDDVADMDEFMVDAWNSVVRPSDKVYHLGDVVINRKALGIVGRLNGKKRLIRGNHDIFSTREYMQYFDEIYGVRVLADMILSHIPLHEQSVTQRFNCNVHGHLHSVDLPSVNHLCVCVERTDFRPIDLDEVRARIAAKRG